MAGISQEELGDRADLHRTYISDIERGFRNPTLKTMIAIANALETPLEKFVVFHARESPPTLHQV